MKIKCKKCKYKQRDTDSQLGEEATQQSKIYILVVELLWNAVDLMNRQVGFWSLCRWQTINKWETSERICLPERGKDLKYVRTHSNHFTSLLHLLLPRALIILISIKTKVIIVAGPQILCSWDPACTMATSLVLTNTYFPFHRLQTRHPRSPDSSDNCMSRVTLQ